MRSPRYGSLKMFIEDRKALILAIMRERVPRQGLPVRREIRNKTSKQRAKAEEKAAQEAWDTDKAAWIEAHGSDRLKKAYSAGYPHNRTYTEERATVELGGGWTADTKNAYE